MRLMLLSLLVTAGVSPALAASPAVIVLLGKGTQIYGCTQAGADFIWRFKAPDAVLTDETGRRIGRHFAGPSWQAEDGSTVTGQVLIASGSPQANAISWLVLSAKEHTGAGLFTGVAYIVRSATFGGAAPATGCDSAHSGAEIRIEYNATYTFFAG